MSNTIGENIRRLRRLHEITQETLAEALNVTIPAVSKWERGECLPDVTMIVPIAAYFGVTTDELLGVSEEVKKQKIQAWYDRYKPYGYKMTKEVRQAQFDELLALMEEYPNEFELLSAYIVFAALDPEFYGDGEQVAKSRKKNYRKIEEACRTIIEKCTDERRRQDAFAELAELYASAGELEKGEQLILENIPFELRNEKIIQLYESVNHPDTPEKYRFCLYYQMKALFENMMGYVAWVEPVVKKLELCGRCLAILEAFGGDDPGECGFWMAHVYFDMCRICANAGKTDEAVGHAESCLRLMRAYDALTDDCIFRSGFMEGHSRIIKDDESQAAWAVEQFDTHPWAAELREREDFRKLLDDYR